MFSPAAASGRFQRSPPQKHLQCGDNTCPQCSGGKRDSAVKKIESWWRERLREREREGLPWHSGWFEKRRAWGWSKRQRVIDVEHVECYVECMLMEEPCPIATQPRRQRDPSLSCICIHRWPWNERRGGQRQEKPCGQREAPSCMKAANLISLTALAAGFERVWGCWVHWEWSGQF